MGLLLFCSILAIKDKFCEKCKIQSERQGIPLALADGRNGEIINKTENI